MKSAYTSEQPLGQAFAPRRETVELPHSAKDVQKTFHSEKHQTAFAPLLLGQASTHQE
jgi:hypothetical protein